MAIIKLQKPAGTTKYLKATVAFLVGGQHVYPGDFVELPEGEANWLIAQDRAVESSAKEAADAAGKSKKSDKAE